MNAFDYFFENTSGLEKEFLAGRETLSYRDLHQRSMALAKRIKTDVGEDKNIILISPNNTFFLVVYLAVIKSGNTVIPLDPMIELDSYKYIRELTGASLHFVVPQAVKKLSLVESECRLQSYKVLFIIKHPRRFFYILSLMSS